MKKTIIYSLLILLSVFAFSSCKKSNSHLVNYTTQGSATTITYTDQNGNTQTVTNPPSNWTLSFTTTDNGMTVKLTAVDSAGGNVGGKIYIDSNQSAQSNGSASSISISAIVP
jgi:ABC-type Fe3+-hydroxamate transport system substrate-binding protein